MNTRTPKRREHKNRKMKATSNEELRVIATKSVHKKKECKNNKVKTMQQANNNNCCEKCTSKRKKARSSP